MIKKTFIIKSKYGSIIGVELHLRIIKRIRQHFFLSFTSKICPAYADFYNVETLSGGQKKYTSFRQQLTTASFTAGLGYRI
ncbi:MAG: hypothetical protein GC181_14155 [Bacteroidetes bacterium]|nr:hypothetical protein [Bacteroidota bacterium]